MNSLPERDLSQALHDLADVPGPASLADRALTGAKRLRHRRMALTGLAALAASASLSAPFLLTSAGQPDLGPAASGQPPSKTATQQPVLGECVQLPSVAPGEKQVAEANWPQFVRTAIGKLPPRTDYTMQSGYDICDPGDQPASNAYAVINLRPGREFGHLTLNLGTRRPEHPVNCADLPSRVGDGYVVLFCEDGSGQTPMVFGVSGHNQVTVTAIYADNRVIFIESIGNPGAVPPIGPDELRPAVIDRALADLLPAG